MLGCFLPIRRALRAAAVALFPSPAPKGKPFPLLCLSNWALAHFAATVTDPASLAVFNLGSAYALTRTYSPADSLLDPSITDSFNFNDAFKSWQTQRQ